VGDVARALGTSNSSLTKLDLYKNRISDAGLSQLAAMLRRNVTLSTLNVAGNEFAHGGDADGQMAGALSTRPPPAAGGAFHLFGLMLARHAEALGLPPAASAWGNDEVFQALWERRRRRVAAFAMSQHPRLGAASVAAILDDAMLRCICHASHL
jgi:hypothetical protein